MTVDATVVGAAGFIGSALVRRLRRDGLAVATPARGAMPAGPLGHVFFCAGLTADFRTRLAETMEAHVTTAATWLARDDLASFTYLSSTRVYQRAPSGHEDAVLGTNPNVASDLYNISKLAGEALVLTDPRPTVRAVRLSNIIGPGDPSANFLTAVLRDARAGAVHIGSGRDAAKDYLALDDAVEAIARVPERARSRLINVAAGENVRNDRIGAALAQRLGATVTYDDASAPAFPSIATRRMRDELGVTPLPFADLLAGMLA